MPAQGRGIFRSHKRVTEGGVLVDGTVLASDGRRIGVTRRGDPGGRPLVLLHGTPGSRVGPLPDEGMLREHRVRLVSYDRPGFGLSDRVAGRTVADAARDVAEVADALGLGSFAVLGRSGGAPHALACAALLPGRVTRAAALVSFAPPTADGDGLDWYSGMTEGNAEDFREIPGNLPLVAARIGRAAARLRADPSSKVISLDAEMPAADRRVISDPALRASLAASFAEAVRQSADGWFDDTVALGSPWGFDPAMIAVPVLLWHGVDDIYSPVGHTRWLAGRIPRVRATIAAGVGHFGAHEILPEVIAWLVSAG